MTRLPATPFPTDLRSHRMSTLTRTLAAALAILALAAPAASARIIDEAPQGIDHPTPSRRVQDLRHLNAGGVQTSSLAGTTSKDQLGDAGPAYRSYDHEAPVPQANVVAASDDDGVPWLTIGFGVAGACLLVAAGAALASRNRLRPGKVAA
jgi:hypothetical protein